MLRKKQGMLIISFFSLLCVLGLNVAITLPATKAPFSTNNTFPNMAMSYMLFDASSNKIQQLIESRKRQRLLELKKRNAQPQRKYIQLANRNGSNTYSRTDVEWLERVVMAEAGGEPYEGQVAVANVVLNRVKAHFGANIYEVIFQKGQFTPAANGTIYRVVPTASVKKAVAAALNGKKVVDNDVLYFINPKIATDMTIPKTKTFVTKIGNHCFYK